MARYYTDRPSAMRPIGHRIRRQLGNVLIDGTFELGARLWGALPQARPERYGVHRTRDVAYAEGGDPAHRLDVYRPVASAESLRPAVLYIHGGSFRILSKDSHFMIALELARAGHVVFSIDYHLAPAHPFPAAVEDAALAYRYVVSEARRWGADPERIVVAGESAGGNLALAVAVMATYERDEPHARRVFQLGVVPKAVMPLCGILQVSDPGRPRGGKTFPTWLQDRIDACAEYYLGDDVAPAPSRALADPLCVLEAGAPGRSFPPTFASVGDRDPLLDDTLRLERVLGRYGVPCEARIYPGQVHAFQALTFRPIVRRHWDEALTFLRRHVEG
jgi:acetyl esterase